MKKIPWKVLGALTGLAAAAETVLICLERKKKIHAMELLEKNAGIMNMMSQWIGIKQQGKALESYFLNRDYQEIAVYGMGMLGKCLIAELQGAGIQIAYAVDQNARKINAPFDVYTLEEQFPYADAIVVTPVFYFESIEAELSMREDCPIILSLQDVLNEVQGGV